MRPTVGMAIGSSNIFIGYNYDDRNFCVRISTPPHIMSNAICSLN